MQALTNVLPSGDGVLFVFYDFETTQDTQYSETARLHFPNLVCLQQFCSRCESSENVDENCTQCGKRKHSFWEDPVGDLLSYLCEDGPWFKQIIVIAQNAKAFHLHFILKRAIFLKLQPEVIMSWQKIMCMKMEHLKFIDSICFLPFPLRKLSGAFGLTASKSWYPIYFNTMANLDYVGQIQDIEYYGVNEIGMSERSEFLAWYEEQKSVVFNNRQTLESYSQDDVTVLRQACQVFRNEFMGIANIDVFQEAVTIASACNKVLCKLFLKPDTIGLIPTGGYTGNKNYSRKAMMWLVYMEQTDECQVRHGRNGRECSLPELPNFSVDGFCAETKPYMNLTVVTGTATHASRSATRPQWHVTH
jgi:hypothetical protein